MDIISKEDPDLLFELTEEIAAGSGGTVYRGVFLPTNEVIAVKIVPIPDDEPIDDLILELNLLKKCSHPNIVKLLGAYQKGPEIFISMELCGGGSATDIFRVLAEPLSEAQISLIARDTLKALDYLHSKKILHRDIKGVNLLLTEEGQVKIVGFGVATQLTQERDKAKTFVGTPYWMAPEVIEAKSGIASYDEKADIWALGITLIELAEVNPPLSDITPMRVLFQIPVRDPPKLQDAQAWSSTFSDFLSCCLQKDPRQRKNARELLNHPFITAKHPQSAVVDLIKLRQKLENESEFGEEPQEEEYVPAPVVPIPAVFQPPVQQVVAPVVAPVKVVPKAAPRKTADDSDDDDYDEEGDDDDGDFSEDGPPPPPPVEAENYDYVPPPPPTAEEGYFEFKQEEETVPASAPAPTAATAAVPFKKPEPKNAPVNPGRSTLSRPKGNDKKKGIDGMLMVNRDNPVHKKLIETQAQELKAIQAKHAADVDKKQKQHQREVLSLQNGHQGAKQNMDKQQLAATNNTSKNHQREVEQLQKKSQTEDKQALALHASERKQLEKDVKDTHKAEKTAWLESQKVVLKNQKQTETDLKNQMSADLKKQKDGKKKIKFATDVMRLEHRIIGLRAEQVFNQKQQLEKQQQDHKLQLQQHDRYQKMHRDQLAAQITMSYSHLEQKHKMQKDHLKETNQEDSDYQDKLHPLEIKHMGEVCYLETQQLLATQELERGQQQRLLASEDKSQRRDYLRQKKVLQKQHLTESKQIKKQSSKAEVRAKLAEHDEAFAKVLAAQDAAFEEKLKQLKEEEEKQLLEHQDYVRSSLEKKQEVRQKEVIEAHQAKQAELKNQQAESVRMLEEQLNQEVLALEGKEKEQQFEQLKEQQESQTIVRTAIFKEQELLLEAQNTEQKTLLTDVHQQMVAITASSPDPALPAKQTAEREDLDKAQRDAVQALLERQEKEKDDLAKEQEQAKKAMIEEHAARVSRVPASSAPTATTSASPRSYSQYNTGYVEPN
eukprot:TRINITY_DN4510_c0_g1_i1.p1 TRINITY_DN4510_c0_g1~~TRINITY_DN4510_c0_g1_i1.p1  ORF type:complete len:1003 (+),score=529.39 TRINITY_DN4510_c0_g1_i1:52-3060(+)